MELYSEENPNQNNTHQLKIWSKFFQDVNTGIKPFEVRRNDRQYEVGDTLILNEVKEENEAPTGAWCAKLVTYKLDDPMFVKEGYVVLGLKNVEV